MIGGLALIMNEMSTELIKEKTSEIFQQRLELLQESAKSYWESDRNNVLSNATLYAESEKVINYSVFGLHNLLQQELARLLSKTGFYDMTITLPSGRAISSKSNAQIMTEALNMQDTRLHLSWINSEHKASGLFITAQVPIHKMGKLVAILTLRRKLDDTRLKKMARNIQAEVAATIGERLLSTSFSGEARDDIILEHLQNRDFKGSSHSFKIRGNLYSVARLALGRTVEGEPLMIYLAISQEKMLSLMEDAQNQNLGLTFWTLVFTMLLAVVFAEKVLIKKIRIIRDGANQISQGDLKTRIEFLRNDELGELALAFNSMAKNLDQNQNKLHNSFDRIEKLANYIQNILSSLQTCIITWNLEGKIEKANEAANKELSEIYGEIEGISLRQFLKGLKPESRQRLTEALRKLRNSEYCEFDLEIEARKNFGIKYMQASLSVLYDADKQPYGAVMSLNNITQRRIIEQQLYHADKLSSIGQLAASVAHEIKNPLASIKTLGQLLQEETSDQDSRREYIDVIVSEVNRLNGVVEQLLKYARPEDSSFGRVKFAEVIKPVIALVSHEAERSNVTISAEFEPDLQVFVDAEKIKQVFVNLIFNALQAFPEGGSVVIRAAKVSLDSPWVSYEVEDNGPGIEKEPLNRIFEPFFSTRQRGSGLGLAIVKKIIDLHGGRISIDSEVNKGTKVMFYLPDEGENK